MIGSSRNLHFFTPSVYDTYIALSGAFARLTRPARTAFYASRRIATTCVGRLLARVPSRIRAAVRWTKGITAKMLIVVVFFVAIPSIVYQRFEAADQEKTALLLESTMEQGRLIAVQLAPLM